MQQAVNGGRAAAGDIGADPLPEQARHARPGLKAIRQITAQREAGGETTLQTRTFLLRCVLGPERLNAVVRAHWDTGNGLQWVLDVVMNEDQARNRKDHGPENLALLRRLALNLAKGRLGPSHRHRSW